MDSFSRSNARSVFCVKTLKANVDFSELLKKDDVLREKVDDVIEALNIVRRKVDEMEARVSEKDATLYFDGKLFSNMGWNMVAGRLDGSDGALNSQDSLIEYIATRTKESESFVRTAIFRLFKQGLLERRRISIKADGEGSDRFITCVILTEVGFKLFDSGTFIYTADFNRESMEEEVPIPDNVLDFRGKK
jgi:hypothetical protein